MKIKIRTTDDQLVVYQEITSAVLYSVFLGIACLAFGAIFIYLGKDESFLLIAGSVFAIGGMFILGGLPKYYRTMESDGGAVFLSATRDGLSIAPLLNMPLSHYPWADISRVVLTKKLIIKETGEKAYSWNQAIVFFRNADPIDDLSALERSKRQLWKSPKGNNVSILNIPKDNIEQIKAKLVQLATDTCEIASYGRVVFDYIAANENFEP